MEIEARLGKLIEMTEEGTLEWQDNSKFGSPFRCDDTLRCVGRTLSAVLPSKRVIILRFRHSYGEDPETGAPLENVHPVLQVAEGDVMASGTRVWALYNLAAAQHRQIS